MEDRFYRGFVAGAIGGVAGTALSNLSYFLGFTALKLADWAAILIFGHVPPFALGEQLFATFIYIGWSGAVGSVFAYFLVWVTDRNLIFKAWVVGTTPYFIVYLLTALFQTPGTVPLPLATALSNYITSTVSAVVMGYGVKALDPAAARRRNPLGLVAQPAAKRIGKDKGQPGPEQGSKDDI